MDVSNVLQIDSIQHKKSSIIALACAVALVGLSTTVQAAKITSKPPVDPLPANAMGAQLGFGGWSLDNILVKITGTAGALGSTDSWFDESNGAYNFAADSDNTYLAEVDDGAATLMGYALAKDYPVGEPAGIKIVNDDFDVKEGKPTNCIMSTSYLEDHFLDTADPATVLCSGPFQSHKRYKLAMLPVTVDGLGSDSIDLVFNVEDEFNTVDGVDVRTSRDYQVFQKINNWTDSRLQGFTIEVGTGVGAGFTKASTTSGMGVANLSLSVPEAIWTFNSLANFSTGLFGPADTKHGRPAGFFDPITRAGYQIDEYPNVSGETDTLTATTTLGSDYADVPAGALAQANQFGAWLPNNMLPFGLFYDDDNNPDTDNELQGWYGWNPDLPTPALSWMKGAADNFVAIADSEILSKANDPLYSVGVIDDLVNIGLNYVVTIKDITAFPGYVDNPAGTADATFTIRITPTKEVANTPAPTYVGVTPTPNLEYTSSDGLVEISPSPTFNFGNVLTARVGDLDLSGDGTVDVTILRDYDGLTQTLTLTELGVDRGVFTGVLPNEYSNVPIGQSAVITVTYVDADDGLGGTNVSKNATTSIETVAPAGQIQFGPATYNVQEDRGSVTVTVERINGSAGLSTVEYSTQSITSVGGAIGGEDYTPDSGELVFGTGVVSRTITIPILDDKVNEETESFEIILSNVQGDAAMGTDSLATVSIIDDDLISFYKVEEDAGSITLVIERTDTTGAGTISYTTADSSATGGSDYTATTGTLNFADGERRKVITVTIVDDTVHEGYEDFSIVFSNATGNSTLVNPGPLSIYIEDNDRKSKSGAFNPFYLLLIAVYLGYRRYRMK